MSAVTSDAIIIVLIDEPILNPLTVAPDEFCTSIHVVIGSVPVSVKSKTTYRLPRAIEYLGVPTVNSGGDPAGEGEGVGVGEGVGEGVVDITSTLKLATSVPASFVAVSVTR